MMKCSILALKSHVCHLLLSPLMKINSPTSEKGYDYGEIEHYDNDCLEKFAESNQSQNQQQQEPEQNVHRKQVHGNKLK